MGEKTFLPETIFKNEKNEFEVVSFMFDNKKNASQFIRDFWREAIPVGYSMFNFDTTDEEKEMEYFHDTITFGGARTYLNEQGDGKYKVVINGNGHELPDKALSWLKMKGYII